MPQASRNKPVPVETASMMRLFKPAFAIILGFDFLRSKIIKSDKALLIENGLFPLHGIDIDKQ